MWLKVIHNQKTFTFIIYTKQKMEISSCCIGGYWRDKHTKFIKCNRVYNFKFKYKDEND